jgi:sugar phosphate isomerase/epimerase
MAWPMVAALGVQVAGQVAGYFAGQDAERERRRAALEEVRRRDRERAYTLGLAKARGAASGVEYESGSLQASLADMAAEFERQSFSERRAARRGAELGEQANALGLATGLGNAFFQFASSNNWWQSSGPRR